MGKEYTSWGWTDEEINEVCIHGVTLNPPVGGVLCNHRIGDFISDEIFGNDAIDLAIIEYTKEHGDDEELPDDLESGPHLIGDWTEDDEGFFKHTLDGEYGYAAIVGDVYTQVVWSKTTTKCVPCSPCYPGQADLDTRDEEKGVATFDLPADCYDEEVVIEASNNG